MKLSSLSRPIPTSIIASYARGIVRSCEDTVSCPALAARQYSIAKSFRPSCYGFSPLVIDPDRARSQLVQRTTAKHATASGVTVDVASHDVRANVLLQRCGLCSRRVADGLIESSKVTIRRPEEASRSVQVGETLKWPQDLPYISIKGKRLSDVSSVARNIIKSIRESTRIQHRKRTSSPQTEGHNGGDDAERGVTSMAAEGSNRIDSEAVTAAERRPRVWLHNKRLGVEVTASDLFQRLKKMGLPRTVAVGRLDVNSEGLLILTDTPRLAELMMNPKTIVGTGPNERVGFERVYELVLKGRWKDGMERRLRSGIIIEGFRYRPVIIERVQSAPTLPKSTRSASLTQPSARSSASSAGAPSSSIGDSAVSLLPPCFSSSATVHPCTTLPAASGENRFHRIICRVSEGKNRELRYVFHHFRMHVLKLKRVQFGPFQLKGLGSGDVMEVRLPSSLLRAMREKYKGVW